MLQIEGRNPVIEALGSEKTTINKILLQQSINEDPKIQSILKLAGQKDIRIELVTKGMLDKTSQTGVHQGVIAIAAKYEFQKLEDILSNIRRSNRDPFIIIVRESMYEHNLGAILRTAACCGVNGVVITKKSEITPNVIRTSMGATNYLDICQTDIFSAIKILKKDDIKVVGIEVLPNAKYYHETVLSGPIALIIGGEDHPLSPEISSKCNFCVKLPLLSPINSLNMSVAAGIVMYEKLRQELI